MTAQCSRCRAPLSSTDPDCARCGAALPRPVTVAAPGRAVILDRGAAPSPPVMSPAAENTPAARHRMCPHLRPRRFPPTAGPVVTGTVTGRVTDDRHPAVGRRVAATAAGVAAAAGAFVLAVSGGLAATSQTLVLVLALGGVLVAARGASVAFGALDGTARAYERRRCTFVLTEPSGTRTTCHLSGRPDSGGPRRGEILEVYGRTGRDGDVRVREAVRVVDRTVVRTRRAPVAVAAAVADAAAVLIVLTCVVAGVALLAVSTS